MGNTNANGKFNVYQAVTDRIIHQLEQGIIPWHKPWSGTFNGAFNRVSKKPYSLLNQMLLAHDGEYATFNQWKNLGGKIRKGAKSEIVVFWKMFEVEDKDENGKIIKKKIPMLRYYNVFHISQVDGVKPTENKLTVEHEPISEAEKIKNDYANREQLVIKELLTDRAFYSPTVDYIEIPAKEQFSDLMEFYSTLFHEMVHSTGHQSRLARPEITVALAQFGSENYSKEELTAEIGSAYLMNHVGIDTEKTFKNSVAYINGWLENLRKDNRLIVSASSKAEKAVKYILNGKMIEAEAEAS